MYKTVLLPIKVLPGKHCWEQVPATGICPHFDTEGGTPRCGIFRERILKQDEVGYIKLDKCKALEEKK